MAPAQPQPQPEELAVTPAHSWEEADMLASETACVAVAGARSTSSLPLPAGHMEKRRSFGMTTAAFGAYTCPAAVIQAGGHWLMIISNGRRHGLL